MTTGHMIVFEKSTGGSNKFYTMIADDNGSFICNYGVNDGKGWHKTITKPVFLWDSTLQDRLNHGYLRVAVGNVNYDMYKKSVKQATCLRSLYGEHNEATMFLMYSLAKWGRFSAWEMETANRLYSAAKSSLKGQN